MKVFVTGALGHIGSALMRKIPTVFPDAEIGLIDNLSTQRYGSLFNLPAGVHYRFHEADLLNADLKSLFAGHDFVIHLAANTMPYADVSTQEIIEQNNYEVTRRVLEGCIDVGSHLIFPSSTSVYGGNEGDIDESLPIEDLKPLTPYSKSKLREESLIREAVHGRSLKSLIYRFGTIFGISPGMRFHTAVNRFCWDAATRKRVTVWKTAMEQCKPYAALEDAINAILFGMQKNLEGTFNVVTLNTTVSEILYAIRQVMPEIETQLEESRFMNNFSQLVSNRRLEKEGFHFTGDLQQEIKKTLRLLNA